MKKIITLLMLALTLCGLPQTAFADTVLTDYERLHGVTWQGESTDQKQLLITDTVVFSSDVKLIGKEITIEKNAVLEIANGAELVLDNTEIFVENGGNIIVSDGKIEMNRGVITNCGLFIIGKNGVVNVKRGTFRTQVEGGVVNNGIISCFDGQSLNKTFSSIKKYDNRFNLVDYSFWLYVENENKGQFHFKYCIDRIETDYKYSVKLENGKRNSIKRSSMSLSEVYSTETRNKLLDRVCAYEMTNDPPDEFKDGYHRERYYIYSFKSNELMAETVWFSISYEPEYDDYMIMDEAVSVVVE